MNGEAKEMVRTVWGYLSSRPAPEQQCLEQGMTAAAALTKLRT